MAYLFTHFTMKDHDDENIYFAVSKDGLHWTDIGGDTPVLTTDLGTKGIRDPFILYDERLEKYFIIATDLNTQTASWGDAVTKGSRGLFVWESSDLIHWSKERLIDLAVENAGCLWAPEAIYCKEKEAWLVFFASMVDGKHRIFATLTKDFVNFGETFQYIEKDNHIIDTNIVWCDGWYYRFSKDETTKSIILEKAKSLFDDFESVYCKALDGYEGLEGPETYYLEDRDEWCLIADQYSIGAGYKPFTVKDMSTGDFKPLDETEYDLGKRKKRHGGVIKITDQQYENLINHYKA